MKVFFGNEKKHAEVNKAVRNSVEIMKKNGAEIVSIADNIDSGWLVTDVSVHLYDLKAHLNVYLNALRADAPVHSVEEVLESGKYHPGIEENLKKAMALDIDTPEYNKRIITRAKVQTQIMKLFADNSLDALVYPHQKQLVCYVGKSQDERNGVLGSVTGFPSISMPAGFSSPTESAPIGVPIGLELLSKPWSESVLIEIAYAFEKVSKNRKNPLSTPFI